LKASTSLKNKKNLFLRQEGLPLETSWGDRGEKKKNAVVWRGLNRSKGQCWDLKREKKKKWGYNPLIKGDLRKRDLRPFSTTPDKTDLPEKEKKTKRNRKRTKGEDQEMIRFEKKRKKKKRNL